MAGDYRDTNIPENAIEKKISLRVSEQTDDYINQQRALNHRSYAAQIIFMLEQQVKVELYKEALDRNMPGWKTQEKAITDEEIRKIIAEEKAKEFGRKLDKKKEEEQTIKMISLYQQSDSGCIIYDFFSCKRRLSDILK